MKQSHFIILIILIVGLGVFGFMRNEKNIKRQSRGIFFSIVHTPQGKNVWALSLRTVYVKEQTGSRIKWDTLWEYPTNLPLRDSTGKEIKDSSGKVMLNPEQTFVPIGKDSVLCFGDISVDSLIRTFKPR